MQIQTRPQATIRRSANLQNPTPAQTTLVEPPPDGYNPSDTTFAPAALTATAALTAGGATAYALLNGGMAANIAGAAALGAAGAVIGGAAGLIVDIGNLGSSDTSKTTTVLGAGLGLVGGAFMGGASASPLVAGLAGLGAAVVVGLGTHAVAQEAF